MEQAREGGRGKEYTVIGLWFKDKPVVAGVIEGVHDCVDAPTLGQDFSGRWAWAVAASNSKEAERMAVAEVAKGEPFAAMAAEEEAIAQAVA